MTETPFYDSLLHDLVGFPARSLVGSRPGHRVTWMGVDLTVSAVGPDDTWVEVTCAYGAQSWTKRLDTTAPAEVLTEVMPAEIFTPPALDMADEPVEDVAAAFDAGIPLITAEPDTPDTPDTVPDTGDGGVADGPPA